MQMGRDSCRSIRSGRQRKGDTSTREIRSSTTIRSFCCFHFVPLLFRIFSGSGNRELAKSICSYLGVNLQDAVVDRFNDGEIEIRLNRNVRGKKIFIVQSTCPPVLLLGFPHS